MQEIKTERLVLREIIESDANQIVAWRSNPEVYKYFTVPKKLTVAEHLNWYHNSYLGDENRVDLIALERFKQIPVGIFGIKKQNEGTCVEVSYLVDPQFQAQGYAREAVNAIMLFAKVEWSCETAKAEIQKNNISSIAFAKRLGFLEEEKESNFIVMKMQL
jgi:RimJ/RimL family protein N-acetyltransferase